MRVPLHQLVIGPDHVPGCSWSPSCGSCTRSRSDERPLEVAPLPGGLWQILNGRHRYLKAVIAGECDVECVVREDRAA